MALELRLYLLGGNFLRLEEEAEDPEPAEGWKLR